MAWIRPKTKTRKDFTLSNEVIQLLELIAKKENKPMSSIVEDAIIYYSKKAETDEKIKKLVEKVKELQEELKREKEKQGFFSRIFR